MIFFVGIITNEIVTKRIETIEDAIGNDAYYSTLKSDRKQDELNEEQVYVEVHFCLR